MIEKEHEVLRLIFPGFKLGEFSKVLLEETHIRGTLEECTSIIHETGETDCTYVILETLTVKRGEY